MGYLHQQEQPTKVRDCTKQGFTSSQRGSKGDTSELHVHGGCKKNLRFCLLKWLLERPVLKILCHSERLPQC